jgi:hypothetical protein
LRLVEAHALAAILLQNGHDGAGPHGHEGRLDLVVGIIHEPVGERAREQPEPDAAVAPGIGQHDDLLTARRPGGIDLDLLAEIEDLAILLALDIHQPVLPSGGVAVAAAVEHMAARRVQHRVRLVAAHGPRKHEAIARDEVLADDPARLLLLAGGRIDIRGIDQPAPVGMKLATRDVEAGIGIAHQPRLHLGERTAHQPDALLAVAGQGQEEFGTVAAPGFDEDVIRAGMETDRFLSLCPAGEIGLDRGTMAAPAPGDHRPRRRDRGSHELRNAQEPVEELVFGMRFVLIRHAPSPSAAI